MISDLDRLVLGAVSILGDSATGKAIKKAVARPVSNGAICSALGRLRKDGLILFQGRKGRRYWSPADAGRFALAEGIE